jgi:hypothetical protein
MNFPELAGQKHDPLEQIASASRDRQEGSEASTSSGAGISSCVASLNAVRDLKFERLSAAKRSDAGRFK